ncbi:MAG: transferase, partial [Desulfobacterales bacterium]|nr:transferase [Desulfobacterales bacterium]
IGENVLVAQRAFLENAELGDGSNAQENCHIIDSTLAGSCITAHGGKIIHADVGRNTFVGFNSFINGNRGARIEIGAGCIVMPHTIIDSEEPVRIPGGQLVWGLIRSKGDIAEHTISLDSLAEIRESISIGNMSFSGTGSLFIDAFKNRINHILLLNGAFYSNGEKTGHAQHDRDISFNILQPYRTGEQKGLYPSFRIKP